MKLHELRSPDGARTRKKRVGRGTGSGHGKTSGRGQKGQLARSQGFRLGFEGGQMPLAQRLPKLGGFRNPFKKQYAVVNLSKLSRFKDGDDVTPERIYTEGLADDGAEIKILGAGKLNRKLSVTAHAVSESARKAIEAKGGSVTVLNQPKPKRKTRPAAGAAISPRGGDESEEATSGEGTEASEDSASPQAPPPASAGLKGPRSAGKGPSPASGEEIDAATSSRGGEESDGEPQATEEE
jgi:large subunit ribosomal protein L15